MLLTKKYLKYLIIQKFTYNATQNKTFFHISLDSCIFLNIYCNILLYISIKSINLRDIKGAKTTAVFFFQKYIYNF